MEHEAADHVEHRANLVDLFGRAADHADEVAGGRCVRTAADSAVDDADSVLGTGGAQFEQRGGRDGADDDDGGARCRTGEHTVGRREHGVDLGVAEDRDHDDVGLGGEPAGVAATPARSRNGAVACSRTSQTVTVTPAPASEDAMPPPMRPRPMTPTRGRAVSVFPLFCTRPNLPARRAPYGGH